MLLPARMHSNGLSFFILPILLREMPKLTLIHSNAPTLGHELP